MIDYIHYLVRSPFGKRGGLIYPSEVNDKYYYGVGGFYLAGENKKINNSYIIHAAFENEIFKLKLNRVSAKYFSTTVDNVGSFIFRAEYVQSKTYIGSDLILKEAFILRRLRLENHLLAEDACINHDFYFVGYSNIFDKQ